MRKIVIHPGEGRGKKGRIFEGTCATMVQWQNVQWTKNGANPLFLELVATEGQIRPLVANLRTGREARIYTGHFQNAAIELSLNKNAPLVWSKIRVGPGGALVTAYMPDLFDVECGMIHEERVRYICMPPVSWVLRNTRPLTDQEMVMVRRIVTVDGERDSPLLSLEVTRRWVEAMWAVAVQFCARLDTRSSLPLLPDRGFQFWLMLFLWASGGVQTLLHAHTCPWPRQLVPRDDRRMDREGVWQPEPPRYFTAMAVNFTHESFAKSLPEAVKLWTDVIRK